MKKLSLLLGTAIFIGSIVACNNPNQNDTMDDSDNMYEDTMDMAPMDTTGMGADTSMESTPIDTTTM